MYTECKQDYLLAIYGEEIPVEASLYEPEFTRVEVAKILNCSPKSVERYLSFGQRYIPELKTYFDEYGFSLSKKRILSSDVVFLEEIQDLKKKFCQDRVIQILTRKYSNQ